MKRVILSIAVLTAFLTASCKKAYECSCEETQSKLYTVVISEWADDVEFWNENEADFSGHTTKNVTTMDKTAKSYARASCASYENVQTEEFRDIGDKNNNANQQEVAYKIITTTQGNCSLEKQ